MKKMKISYFHIKTICTIVFIFLLKSSFAQEVDTSKDKKAETKTVTDKKEDNSVKEEAQSEVLDTNTKSFDNDGINPSHKDIITPTSPSSIFTTIKSYNTVDMSTGKVNVKVPIAVAGTEDIKVPVELNYITGGIKLRDVASWVGLGWNLSAGGKITRILNRFPDTLDGSIDSLLNAKSWTYSTLSKPAIEGNFDDRVKKKDTQPDIFHFEIPGKSGMFVLDSWGNASTIPYQNIEINYDKTTKYFEIKDDKGNKYFFQDIEKTEIQIPVSDDIARPNIKYESAWHLSQIQNIKGDYIFFEYKKLKIDKILNQYIYKTCSKKMTIETPDLIQGPSCSSLIYDTYVDPL
ncbi:MAG: hypothetical protein IMY73_04535, partial [Bacteroidetes bacterium]|nr:hypothetical protein [Bacteroidota bacterium]